jgi:hypothetical protein
LACKQALDLDPNYSPSLRLEARLRNATPKP